MLSTFPGIDVLGDGFEDAGYCVVKTGDPFFGQRGIEGFHPPAGAFVGVIGGPPCQHWSKSHNLAGDKDGHPNLIPEFERIVSEAQPEWFLMENVTGAPTPFISGYHPQSQRLFAGEFGVPQRRERRFTFGSRTGTAIAWPRGNAVPATYTFTGRNSPQRRRDGTRDNGGKDFTLEQYLEAFGLPPTWSAPAVLKRKQFQIIGNAVPLPEARALAEVIRDSNNLGANT